MYFSDCHTAADCKARYKELAKQLHPDKTGGDSTAFQQMQEEYEARLHKLQSKNPINSKEAMEITKAILELLRITKPDYYEMLCVAAQSSAANMLAAALGNLFPKKKDTLNGVIELLK